MKNGAYPYWYAPLTVLRRQGGSLGSIWKPGIWPTARDFSPAEAIFPQEYFVYYKGKWCTAGGKDPLFGHVDGFQIDPKIFKKDFNCLKGMEFIWDLFCDFFPYKSQNRQRRQAMPSWLKLRQHRTIASASLSRLFAPLPQFRKWEIHTVFLHFRNFELEQKSCLRLLAELCGAALIFLRSQWPPRLPF